MSQSTKVRLWRWAVAVWAASVLTTFFLQHVIRVWA